VLGALASASALYRTYPSSHDDNPSEVRFVLPLSGPVTIAWGGETKNVNAHVVAPDQRWGYDLIVTSNRISFRGSGEHVSDYYAYGKEVLAPAAGIVHTVHDGEPESPIGRKGKGDDLGNHVALQVTREQFLYIAHMQPGSVHVKPGDRVAPGQPLGRVGNSGTSSEPHVHLHLQDSSRRYFAEAIPFHFFDYCVDDIHVPDGMPFGGRENGRWVGQIVSHADMPRGSRKGQVYPLPLSLKSPACVELR
jgi:murein DD-endopeptidase MepM/ murein hydrolase activator NlpD